MRRGNAKAIASRRKTSSPLSTAVLFQALETAVNLCSMRLSEPERPHASAKASAPEVVVGQDSEDMAEPPEARARGPPAQKIPAGGLTYRRRKTED